MTEIIAPVLIITGIGVLFGVILTAASKLMAVPVDPNVEKVRAALPGANCGACGFAGCDEYAKAVCEGKAPANACIPGGADTSKAVSAILGVDGGDVVAVGAFLACQGTHAATEKVHEYKGIPTCAAANTLFHGEKACSYACLGLGDCISACKFGALSIVGGIAHVDLERCTGCGACVKKCPKGLLSLSPKHAPAHVLCSNRDKGAVTRKACKTGCIGCMKCVKACESDAIHVQDNLASIDAEACTGCGKCAETCPVGAIQLMQNT